MNWLPRLAWVFGAVAAASVSLSACSVDIPEGVFSCDQDDDCPHRWRCRHDGYCYRTADDVIPMEDASTPGPDAGPCACDGGCEDCTATCGDGACDDGEQCTSCPADCGPCQAVCGDGVCNGDETCESCADCRYGHLLAQGNDGDPCDAPETPYEHWRCVSSPAQGGAMVSQVCRGGRWISFNVSPRDCAACMCNATPPAHDRACCAPTARGSGCV